MNCLHFSWSIHLLDNGICIWYIIVLILLERQSYKEFQIIFIDGTTQVTFDYPEFPGV